MDDKHVHEWVFDRMPMEIRCLTCPDAKMSLEEGERRLNATERLSAEDAREASQALTQILEWAVPQILGKKPNITHSELEAYASALEGEDD